MEPKKVVPRIKRNGKGKTIQLKVALVIQQHTILFSSRCFVALTEAKSFAQRAGPWVVALGIAGAWTWYEIEEGRKVLHCML